MMMIIGCDHEPSANHPSIQIVVRFGYKSWKKRPQKLLFHSSLNQVDSWEQHVTNNPIWPWPGSARRDRSVNFDRNRSRSDDMDSLLRLYRQRFGCTHIHTTIRMSTHSHSCITWSGVARSLIQRGFDTRSTGFVAFFRPDIRLWRVLWESIHPSSQPTSQSVSVSPIHEWRPRCRLSGFWLHLIVVWMNPRSKLPNKSLLVQLERIFKVLAGLDSLNMTGWAWLKK